MIFQLITEVELFSLFDTFWPLSFVFIGLFNFVLFLLWVVPKAVFSFSFVFWRSLVHSLNDRLHFVFNSRFDIILAVSQRVLRRLVDRLMIGDPLIGKFFLGLEFNLGISFIHILDLVLRALLFLINRCFQRLFKNDWFHFHKRLFMKDLIFVNVWTFEITVLVIQSDFPHRLGFVYFYGFFFIRAIRLGNDLFADEESFFS